MNNQSFCCAKLSPSSIECGSHTPDPVFRTAKTEKGKIVILNRADEDVTKFFHLTLHNGGVIQVQFKKAPSHGEWKIIAGKRKI